MLVEKFSGTILYKRDSVYGSNNFKKQADLFSDLSVSQFPSHLSIAGVNVSVSLYAWRREFLISLMDPAKLQPVVI
jgi:hypothetical protein